MDSIKLISNEGEEFEVEVAVAKKSEVIKEMLENCDDSGENVPLPSVNSDQLRKVVQWLKHHRDDPLRSVDEKDYNCDNIPEWDKSFFNISQEELFDLILAANYLDIKDMLDLLAKSVANLMRGKTAQEIRDTFNIKCDLTKEEIERIQNENEWEIVANADT